MVCGHLKPFDMLFVVSKKPLDVFFLVRRNQVRMKKHKFVRDMEHMDRDSCRVLIPWEFDA